MRQSEAPADVVVTGVGAVTPLGNSAQELSDGWRSGRTGIRDKLARCSAFDPGERLSRREVRIADRGTQMSLVAADEAVRQAGWDRSPPAAPDRIGCVIGTSFGLTALEDQLDRYRELGPTRLSPHGVTQVMSNAGAATIAIKYGWRGESFSVGAGCAAGVQAIGAGIRMLRSGSVDAVLVGASDSSMTPYAISAYRMMGATSRSGICRPYDVRRDGFIPGEGSGIMTLERSAAARARGAPVIAEVAGYAARNDSHHLAVPHPQGLGLIEALTAALESAALSAGEIDYINPHGASTPVGDRVETAAIEIALGEGARAIPVSSTKSAIGHLQNAAGAAEVVSTALALRDGVAPANLGLEQVDPELRLSFVKGEPQRLEDRAGKGYLAALAFSFGLGGHNAAVVIRTPRAGG